MKNFTEYGVQYLDLQHRKHLMLAARTAIQGIPMDLKITATMALLTLSLFSNSAFGAGAITPFTTLEAENGAVSGGAASSVIATGSILPGNPTPEKEASGLGLVALNATGQSVSWTNPVANANAIVVRACIPDAPAGGGITATLNLYVNGVFRQTLTLSSKQSWNYKSATNRDDPSGGDAPFHFYNEDQAFITGPAVPAGSTLMLKRDAANTAAYYKIDCVDVENVPAPKSQPANSLSITSAPYNADPTFTTDSLASLQQCIIDARAQGKSVWIPPGKFKMFSLGGATVNLKGVTVSGAGMWHSTIYEAVPAGATYTHHFDLDTNSVLRDVTVDQNSTTRVSGGGSDYALMSVNDNWLIERVWIQHGTNWLSGSNGTIKDCRVTSSWGDGINLNNGNAYSPSKLGLNLTASNNFVRGVDDDNIATYSDSGACVTSSSGGCITSPLMENTKILNNTSVACYGANGLRVAGGKNVYVQGNLIHSNVANNGMRISVYGTSGHPIESATISGNVIVRSGGMYVGSTTSTSKFPNEYTKASIENNQIIDSFRTGIEIGTVHEDLVVSNNVIFNPAQTGIIISKGVIGVGTFQYNSVSGYSTGGFYNASPDTFTPALSGNSWQSDIALAKSGWTLSSSHNTAALSKAIDGDLGTRWDTNGIQSPGQWFQVDMGAARTFSQIVMDQSAAPNDYPRGYQVNVSNDGINWGSPVATGLGTASVTVCSFLPQTARYIRVTQTGSAQNSYWSIYEFNVKLSHSINAGGEQITPYLADSGFSGGSAYSTSSAVDTTTVLNPAPEEAYKTERYGNMTYTLPGLSSGTTYKVRLHFSENYFSGAGQRQFNVIINGAPVLTNYDIFAAAGKFKATVKEFSATANSNGQIVIQFVGVVNNAKIGAIEVQTL